MMLTAGTRLGPYEVVGPLGTGGMGEVYRARDTQLKRDVALKVLPAGVATDPALDRLERCVDQRDLLVVCSLKSEPGYIPLHGHPRYQALLRKMNLEP